MKHRKIETSKNRKNPKIEKSKNRKIEKSKSRKIEDSKHRKVEKSKHRKIEKSKNRNIEKSNKIKTTKTRKNKKIRENFAKILRFFEFFLRFWPKTLKKKFSNSSFHRRDRFYQKIVQIGAILPIFKPFEVFANFREIFANFSQTFANFRKLFATFGARNGPTIVSGPKRRKIARTRCRTVGK